MIPATKTTKTRFEYSSGHVKITSEVDRIVFMDANFSNKKELRKLLFLYNDSGLVVTINFNEPGFKKMIEEI